LQLAATVSEQSVTSVSCKEVDSVSFQQPEMAAVTINRKCTAA
jgi:hypothetical protein